MTIGGIAGATAGTTAAAAAAAQKRRENEEEEKLATYSPEDLEQKWEFKIVRSDMNAFRNPAKLRRLVDEEARAGWELLEKFDDARVRFKRPVSARARDSELPVDIDPYRTRFEKRNWGAILGISLALGIVLMVGVLALILA